MKRQKKISDIFAAPTKKRCPQPDKTHETDSERASSDRQCQIEPASSSRKGGHRSDFHFGWLKKYTWLRYESAEKGMFCNWCSTHNCTPKHSAHVWVRTGCVSLREDSIKRHETSAMHQVARGLHAQAIQAEADGGIAAALGEAANLERQAFMAALRTMYWLMKREIAHTTNFASLLELQKLQGCQYLQMLKVDGTQGYTSERTMQEIVLSIGNVIRERVLQDVAQSSFLGLLFDETCDISVFKQLNIYAKIVIDGKSAVRFLGVEQVDDGKADTIRATVMNFCDRNGIQLRGRLGGIGSDGASVMVGRHNGVAVQLKNQACAFAVGNHCVAHREALAAKSAGEKLESIKIFNKTLDSVYWFFEASANRTAVLRNVQETMDKPRLKPKQPKAVRWLSHDGACDTMRRILPCVITALEHEAEVNKEDKAIGILRRVNTWRFVAILHMMCDVLPHLTILSKRFQASALDLCMVRTHLASTISAFEAQLIAPGRHMQELPGVLTTLSEEGYSMGHSEQDLEAFQRRVHRPYIEALIEQLQVRFPHVELLEAFAAIFDPDQLRGLEGENLADYGREELEVLADHYQEVVNGEELQRQFEVYKHMAHEDSYLKNLQCIITRQQETLSELCKLAELALVIPMNTADCERGFSSVKRIKTAQRNRIKQDVLNSLLLASIEGSPLEAFDFDAAADKWAAMRNRHLNVARQ